MTEIDDAQEKLFNKIRGLLRKAESSSFEEEANSFLRKAQEMMLTYTISEEELWVNDPEKRAKIAEQVINLQDRAAGAQDKRLILRQIADLSNCRFYYYEGGNRSVVVGYPNDLIWVEMLFISILTQAQFAQAVGQAIDDGKTHHKTFKSNWWYAYRQRINQRLRETYRLAREDANVTTGSSTDLVLLSRKQQVDKWIDTNLNLGRGKHYSGPNKNAAGAQALGSKAANDTDISGGRGRLSKGKRALNA